MAISICKWAGSSHDLFDQQNDLVISFPYLVGRRLIVPPLLFVSPLYPNRVTGQALKASHTVFKRSHLNGIICLASATHRRHILLTPLYYLLATQ